MAVYKGEAAIGRFREGQREAEAASREANRGTPFVSGGGYGPQPTDPRTEARGAGFRGGGGGGGGQPSAGVITAPAPTGFRAPATPADPAAPGANLAAAAPATKPEFTPIRASQGGSMVLGTNNLGIQEIRGTGHPSSQVFTNYGRDADYPEAVQRWHEGMAREAGEMAREQVKTQGEIEKERVAGPFLVAAHAATGREAASVKTGETPAQVAGRKDKDFRNKIAVRHGVFDNKAGKHVLPDDEYIKSAVDEAAEVAAEKGEEAGFQYMKTKMAVKKYLRHFTPQYFQAHPVPAEVREDPAKFDQYMLAMGPHLEAAEQVETAARAKTMREYQEAVASGQFIGP